VVDLGVVQEVFGRGAASPSRVRGFCHRGQNPKSGERASVPRDEKAKLSDCAVAELFGHLSITDAEFAADVLDLDVGLKAHWLKRYANIHTHAATTIAIMSHSRVDIGCQPLGCITPSPSEPSRPLTGN
jgi:hypothetical protein